jgi:hypothetical protein
MFHEIISQHHATWREFGTLFYFTNKEYLIKSDNFRAGDRLSSLRFLVVYISSYR